MVLRQLFFATRPARGAGTIVTEDWWQSAWFWWLLAFASTLPFLLSPLPPLGDFFSHIGRYHVMLHHGDSPWLSRYYAFHWGLLPNLGQDLLMVPFGRIFGVERGATILAALIPPAMVLGFRALSKAVHGSVEPIALLALPFTYSFTYLFGFMNYHTGLVVLLWTMVFWQQSIGWRPVLRYGALGLLAAAAWLCHLSAWALVVAAVGAFEFAAIFDRRGWRFFPELPSLLLRMVPVLLPLLLGLLGSHTQPMSSYARSGEDNLSLFFHLYYLKFYWLAYPLRDQWKPLDLASLAVIALVPGVLIFLGKVRLHLGLSLFAAGVFGLFWVVPYALMNGYYADLRLLPVVWFSGLLACQVADFRKLRSAIAIFAVALFVVRLGATTYGWHEHGRELKEELGALDLTPKGARIASFAPQRMCKFWANRGVDHLASLAIVRRDAFVNSEWDIPGQQLMQPILLRGTPYNAIYPMRSLQVPGRNCNGKSIEELLAGLPRDRFDYVWIFRIKAPAETGAWLKPIFRGPQGTLYVIVHEAKKPAL